MGQDREYRCARRALDTPDGDAIEPETEVMRVACHTPSAATGGLVFQLKADGQDESHHQFDKRLAVAQQLKVDRFVLKIDGNGTVFSWLFGLASHGSPPSQMVCTAHDTPWR